MSTEETFPDYLMPCLEKFFASDHERPSSLDIYDDVLNDPIFFPLQRRAEMIKMLAEARRINPTTIMEIGADKGGSLYHWCKCFDSVKRVIACELKGCPYNQLFEKAFPHIEFLWIPTSSYASATVRQVGNWLNERKSTLDVLFIDGDKSHMDIDFDCYKHYMSHNGIVFFHDITVRPITAVWRSMRNLNYGIKEIVDKSDTAESLKREREGIPPATPYEGWMRYWKGQACGVGVVYMNGNRI